MPDNDYQNQGPPQNQYSQAPSQQFGQQPIQQYGQQPPQQYNQPTQQGQPPPFNDDKHEGKHGHSASDGGKSGLKTALEVSCFARLKVLIAYGSLLRSPEVYWEEPRCLVQALLLRSTTITRRTWNPGLRMLSIGRKPTEAARRQAPFPGFWLRDGPSLRMLSQEDMTTMTTELSSSRVVFTREVLVSTPLEIL
jgi:hypothetical protein